MSIDQIRDILSRHGRLAVDPKTLAPTTDLYEVGLTSLTPVHLMLALEDHFQVEFSERMLGRKTFESIQSIAEAIEELRS